MDAAVQQLLMAQLAGRPEAAGVSMVDVVAEAVGDDPMAAQLVAALRERERNVPAGEEEDDVIDVVEVEPDPEVADVLTRLYAEVEELRARSDTFADALGACRRCFGEDLLCAVCRGRGAPGGREPDPILFAQFVEPACRRVA